jgi:hypothetical protein
MTKRFPSAILATAVIPWDEEYRFQEDLFRRQVRLLRDGLTPYIYLFGTAGEGYAVSDKQFDAIVDAFRDEMLPGAHPMVGVVNLSLQTIIERIERCRDREIRTFQLSLPGWGALTDREVDIFFEQTCGRFPDCQFLHYNLPRAGRVLGGDDYARLAPAHSNLVAVKFGGSADATYLADLLGKAPDIQFFLTEFGYASVRDHHECGFLISLASSHFTRAREYFDARGAQLEGMARELELVMAAIKDAVADHGHMDGAYDKMFTKIHMPEFPLRLLPPYTAAGDQQFETFLAALPESWRATDGPET